MTLDAFVGSAECLTPADDEAIPALVTPLFPDRVAAAPATPARLRWLRSAFARQAVATSAGWLVAVLADVPGLLAIGVLALWTTIHLHRVARAPVAVASTPASTLSLTPLLVPLAVVGVSVAYAGVGQHALAHTVEVLAPATAVLLAMTAIAHAVRGPRRVLFVGDRAAFSRAATSWARRDGIDLVGAILVEPDPELRALDLETYGAPVAGDLGELPDRVADWAPDLVVVVPSERLGPAEIRQLSWVLEGSGTTLAVCTAVDSVAAHRLSVTSLAGCTLAQVGPSRPPAHVRALKSLMDRLAGAVLLLLVSPFLAAMVVAVRLDSPGSGLFRQTRVGRNGVPFTIYKLRTMCTQAELLKPGLAEVDEGNGVLFKMRTDPRVTRVGRLLRKTSLDELPQLINVVKGEMSLVGPRPALPDEVLRYEEVARRRLAVRPGITGLWQVSGRSDLDWDRTVELDAHYADNITISRDLMICLQTIRAVTTGRGAY